MKKPATVKLEELCSLITDGKHGDCKNQDGSGYYFISAKDILDGRINYDNARQITYDDYIQTHKRTDLKSEDILLTNSGTIGRIAIAADNQKTGKTTFQKSVAILKPIKDKINPQFLYYTLTFNKASLVNSASGAAQKNLLLGDLKRFSIRIPPLFYQEVIVNILSAYDDLIENNRRRMQLLEQAARLLYKEWFVRLRFPGHEHVKIKNGVPQGWERVATPNIIDINPKESVPKNSDIRYVPMSSLSEAGMTVDTSDMEIRQKATSVKFRNGDILLARITPCLENGKTAFVNFLEENEVASGSTEFIVLRGRNVSPYFVYCLARTHDFRGNAIKSMIGSSGRQRVQTSCFDDFILGFPPKQFLLQFDDAVSSCFSQIGNLMRQNKQLRNAHDFLLPRLMNGEIAV